LRDKPPAGRALGKQYRVLEKWVNDLDMNDFWHGKRVFLTGHTGFKGCWMLIWLDMLGAEVFGYSLPPLEPSLYRSAYAENETNGVFADVRDGERLKRELSNFKPDVVFHLAAQPLVRESYREPVLTYATNVMGTVNLLEAVRAAQCVKSVVVITSDKCYKDMDWEWGYRETDDLGGSDPYSSSKACAELACEAWRKSYFEEGKTLLATARAGNVIGGGDWAADRLVPDAIRAFQKKEPLTVRFPKAVRPWQHVLEPLRGYMMLARRLYDGDASCATAWNFGPPTESAQNVENLARILAELWSDDVKYRTFEDEILKESRLLRLDSGRAVQRLNWNPRLTLMESIRFTVEWYKSVLSGGSVKTETRKQIVAYMEKETSFVHI
jgi:CDP-glucose 4,6-dehydratase